jgi:PAS domain S-box-containing protein
VRECVKVLDLEGRLLSIDEEGCSLLEVDDPKTLIGRSWIDLWSGPDHLSARAAVARAARGEFVRFEGYGHTMRGRGRWWETEVSPIAGPDGKPVQLRAVSRDVTERRAKGPDAPRAR